MKQIDQFIFEKLTLNKQSQIAEDLDLEQKIKLALNFDDSVFNNSSNIYKKCLKCIMGNLEMYTKAKNTNNINIITTQTTWNRKIKEFPSCEKYKYLFTIDDKEFIELVKKYNDKLYYYVNNNIMQLGIIWKDDKGNLLIYFGDAINGKSKFKQYWLTNS